MSGYPYPPNPLREDLQSQYRPYERRADARPSIWNTPSAREEAGRCLACAMPWQEYDASAPLDGRGTGYNFRLKNGEVRERTRGSADDVVIRVRRIGVCYFYPIRILKVAQLQIRLVIEAYTAIVNAHLY